MARLAAFLYDTPYQVFIPLYSLLPVFLYMHHSHYELCRFVFCLAKLVFYHSNVKHVYNYIIIGFHVNLKRDGDGIL